MKQIEGSARRVLKESKRIAAFWAVIGCAMLGWAFFNHAAISSLSMLGLAAVVGVGIGVNLAILLRNLD